jgi:hypothetical protein
MHNLIERKIAEYTDAIEKAKTMEDDIVLAERLASDKRVWIDSDVNISWNAKSMNEIKSLLRLFAQEGYLLDHVNDKTGPTMWVIKGINFRICLLPQWGVAKGGTCRLVEIERKTITTPIYKLVCDEEAEDASTS